MPSLAALTIYLFGGISLPLGIWTLLRPDLCITQLQLHPSALGSVYGNGLAATAIGCFYLLAAYQENRAFFALSVPLRFLNMAVFWPLAGTYREPAIGEATLAVLTTAALLWERR